MTPTLLTDNLQQLETDTVEERNHMEANAKVIEMTRRRTGKYGRTEIMIENLNTKNWFWWKLYINTM